MCSRIASRLQKSTGGVWPVATRGEEPREPTSGLATPGESIGAAKARRKPGPRRQSRDTGGGFPHKPSRESATLWEQPVDGRRSGSNKPHPLTRVWEKRSSVLRGESGQRDPATRGVRQRASEVLRQPGTRSTTPRRGGSHQGVAALGSTPHRSAGGVKREWSKLPKLGTAPSSALHLGPGRRKAGWRRSRSRVSARRVAAVGEAQATRSGIRRSTGARVVSRLQKSVRSIFLARSRGAERRTEEARGSTQRRFSPRQGRATPRRVKGCEAEGRERQVSVKTHPSIARSGTEPAEGVLDQ
jgi:hypothetical protein